MFSVYANRVNNHRLMGQKLNVLTFDSRLIVIIIMAYGLFQFFFYHSNSRRILKSLDTF